MVNNYILLFRFWLICNFLLPLPNGEEKLISVFDKILGLTRGEVFIILLFIIYIYIYTYS